VEITDDDETITKLVRKKSVRRFRIALTANMKNTFHKFAKSHEDIIFFVI